MGDLSSERVRLEVSQDDERASAPEAVDDAAQQPACFDALFCRPVVHEIEPVNTQDLERSASSREQGDAVEAAVFVQARLVRVMGAGSVDREIVADDEDHL